MSFPESTHQDTEMHFFGSGALSYPWWRIESACDYQADGYTAVDNWGWLMTLEDPYTESDGITVHFNHSVILKAIRQISRLKLSEDNDDMFKGNKYVTDIVIKECRTWVFKGPDACDFDAGMADEVMQWAAIGEVAYR